MEIWKSIIGFEYYEISDLGRVKSLSRKIKTGRGYRTTKDIILTNNIHKDGYEFVNLYSDTKQFYRNVHQLVAIAFLNYIPNNYLDLVVDHKDNNPSNNKLDNLQIVTQRINTSKDRKNKTSKYTGVHLRPSGKWCSSIYLNGKTISIGLFNSEIESSKAYESYLSKTDA